MLQGRAQVLLALLAFTVKVDGAPHGDLLRGELIRDDDLARLILVQFLSELMEMDEGDVDPRLVEQLGIRETVMRRQLPLTQRARPAGCRNFFWKTFTSC
uniref:Somatostatin/Cortistatin C-terminal domain-containing protein n=1 Tax=Neogobius melanostomus TaxID=47308 RepID=A0A8C6TGY1_9GOBI